MIDMLVSQVLDLMTPVLLAAMAGALCERAGVFNIALEGKMLVGAFVAVAASIAFGSPVLAVPAAVVCTAIFALPLALGGARFGGDPIVIGIGLNLLASGLTTYLLSAIFGVTGTLVDPAVTALPRFGLAALADIPVLGAILGAIGIARIALWQWLGFYDYGPHWMLIAATVGGALLGIVTFGSLMGSMLPFALKRFGFDPASASAPLVATLVDVTGLVIYFGVAALILTGTLL